MIEKVKTKHERTVGKAIRTLVPGKMRKVLKSLTVAQLDKLIDAAEAEKATR